MEPWLLFTIWGAILVILTVVLKLLFAPFISSVVMSSMVANAFLIGFNPYHVNNINVEITLTDTIKTFILILSAVLWMVWSVYQVFRDHKHKIFCYYCRVKKDIVPVEIYEPIQYDDERINDMYIDVDAQ